MDAQSPLPKEQDRKQGGDKAHCEELLRTTLHCDDKEKLRRKLALLKREYIRTAERLQRAERVDAVRRHVRSRICQQDQRDPEVTSNPRLNSPSFILNSTNGTATTTGGPADSANWRRSQAIRLLLPSDASCPQTPDFSPEAATGLRASPALRLRSRRSRLRWERRSAEASRSAEDNSDEGQKQTEKREAVRAEGSRERVKPEGTEVVNENDELFSGTDSESPSLLLTHWNTCGQNETGAIKGKETQEEKETELRADGEKASESSSLLLTHCNPAVNAEEREQDVRGKETEGGENSRGQRVCEDFSDKEAAEKTGSGDAAKIKEEQSKLVGGEPGEKSVGLLNSCTLVEGLLFPAEYYIRTTRRMTLSQSQPDMQAVILSQLSVGRRRRSRGRGSNRRTPTHEHSDQHTQTGLSESGGPQVDSPSADSPAELNSQSSSEVSDQIKACQINTDACFSPTVAAACPVRGRRMKRGRGRGRPQTPRCSLRLDSHQSSLGQASPAPQPTSTPLSSSPSLYEADGPKTRLAPGEAAPALSGYQPGSSISTAAQSGADGAQCSSAHLEKVFPIFLKSSNGTNRATQMSQSEARWRSLLLPSSPPAQTSLLPLPSLLLFKNLTNFDIPQDFHLPDDQFASLKLHKLRQVAVDSGVEHFTSPSHRKCSSDRRSDPRHLLSLTLTPTITDSLHPAEAAAQSAVLSVQSAEDSSERDVTENPGEQQTECQTHITSAESVQHCPADQYTDTDTVTLNAESQSSFSTSNTHRSDHHPVKPQSHMNVNVIRSSDELQIQDYAVNSSGDQADCLHPLSDYRSTNHPTEDIKTRSLDCCLQKTPAAQLCNTRGAPDESPAEHMKSSLDGNTDHMQHRVHSELLLSPPLLSAPCTFMGPQVCSPTLPSVGLTPHPDPLSCSPSAPPLTLPPPHSPSTQALSPPALSPCPSLHLRQAPSPEPPHLPGVSSIQTQGSGDQEETGEEPMMGRIHTLKAPAGGRLVDVCCLSGSSGGLCVAAAGKWAVCLWIQTSAGDWILKHTWAFNEPVINMFPVPDAAGLLCVTLGQLEIREVRMLSCSSLSQAMLCEDVVQAVVGVSRSRVVTSSRSACGSTLQVFTPSDSSSSWSSRPLVSPGVCVGSLAVVDGLSDALIGSDEGGRLFVWNIKTGQLLRSIVLTDGFSHTACLRGYSYCGVVFVLLQHQLLGSMEEEAKEKQEQRKKDALFSLVAVNPLSGKSVLACGLCAPNAWSGRLCEADVSSSSLLGLSQSGCVCVWELGRREVARMLWAPEGDGWQLARWGEGGTLVTGHHNGDVTLHRDVKDSLLSESIH